MELINTSVKRNSVAGAAIAAVTVPFQILTTTLLSLLLPLSFLLLARFATAHYLLSVSDNYPTSHPDSFLCSVFLYTKYPSIVHLLVAIISVASLTRGLTGEIAFLSRYPDPLTRTRLCVAWIFLFAVQFFVGLGLEGSIVAGIDGSGFGTESSLLCRVIFFFGLHETTLFWGRAVVKPVVDDTIFGYSRAEGLAEKVVMGLSYGGLWWCRLRLELEALVVMPEVKRELMMQIGAADVVGWWLYYLTVTIGMVKVVKGLIFTVAILTRRTVEVVESQPNEMMIKYDLV